MKQICLKIVRCVILVLLPLMFLAACAADPKAVSPPLQTDQVQQNVAAVDRQPPETVQVNEAIGNDGNGDSGDDGWRICVARPDGEEIWSFTETEIAGFPPEQAEAFVHAYSSINNWPTAGFLAADGYSIESLLKIAGVFDTAQTITFRAEDGYEISLTREQLLSEQFYFPLVGESFDGAEPVIPIIAYRMREGTSDLSELREEKPTLVFGQRNPFEHTNPAFVERVTEIIVDDSPCGSWGLASTFPAQGQIAEGETVKLQHESYGFVKLFYTLDGSDPTPLSKMYNPSTYQPELNVPIPITEPVTIKVLATGFGKNDSDIAEFEFYPIS